MPNFLILDKIYLIYSNHNAKIKTGSYKTFKADAFINDIYHADLCNIIRTVNGVNDKMEKFQLKLIKVIDYHAPIVTISRKKLKQKRKPWITDGILKSISVRNKYYTKFLKTKDGFWYQCYKCYQDMIDCLIRQSKENITYLTSISLNIIQKKIWSGIRNILDLEKYKSNSDICLKIEGQFITSQAQVANKFNHFFINVAQNLVSKLGNTNKSFKDYLQEPQYEKFFMKPVTSYEVSDLIKNLDESKSPDPYNIPVKLIKLIPYNMSGALTDIFNESFKTGIFSDLLKLAHVTPIHKGNSRLAVTHYRPISVLPIISKVFEQIVHKRVYNFFISHNIIYEHQFGFQKNKSTSLEVLDIYSKLIKSIENKEFSCCIFLDFAKAFDTVNHEILLSKLEHYGITGIVNDWFRSYLSLRSQKVKINGFLSDEQYIKCGVPQGSVPGPLLFLIYINDMPYASKILGIHLFADDTSIFISNKNLEELELL